jgi:hypothetical protein
LRFRKQAGKPIASRNSIAAAPPLPSVVRHPPTRRIPANPIANGITFVAISTHIPIQQISFARPIDGGNITAQSPAGVQIYPRQLQLCAGLPVFAFLSFTDNNGE